MEMLQLVVPDVANIFEHRDIVGTGESSGAMKNRKNIYRDDKDGK